MLLFYDRYKVTFILTFCDVNRDNLEEEKTEIHTLLLASGLKPFSCFPKNLHIRANFAEKGEHLRSNR